MSDSPFGGLGNIARATIVFYMYHVLVVIVTDPFRALAPENFNLRELTRYASPLDIILCLVSQSQEPPQIAMLAQSICLRGELPY